MYLELLYKIIIFYDIRYLDNLALRIKIPVRCILHCVLYIEMNSVILFTFSKFMKLYERSFISNGLLSSY